ncbi:hypothetical protein GW796_00030 [archaeon]|nr:hypothetical protein [archaeon]
MKTSKQMAQEYIDEYSQVERNENECLFEYYKGNNGNEIKAKKTKYLKHYLDLNNLDTLLIDSKEKEFWDKINGSLACTVYMWGSSILFDFNENFYYELPCLRNELSGSDSFILKNQKSYIAKFNKNLENFEESFETDIIIL